jgi:hypothetical protein
MKRHPHGSTLVSRERPRPPMSEQRSPDQKEFFWRASLNSYAATCD